MHFFLNLKGMLEVNNSTRESSVSAPKEGVSLRDYTIGTGVKVAYRPGKYYVTNDSNIVDLP
jgi:hypothetical protein